MPYFDGAGKTALRPWHGGDDRVGSLNIAAEGHRAGGTLLPEPQAGQGRLVRFGTSYIQLVRLTPGGVEARGLLAYSQSSHWDSPHHDDQARLYLEKRLRPLSLDWPELGVLEKKRIEGDE